MMVPNYTIRKLLNTVEKNVPKADLEMIELAYEFSKAAHAGQKRATGVEYIEHDWRPRKHSRN